MHCMLIGRLEHNRQTIIDKIFVLHSDLSLVWPAMATNHNRKHSHLDIMVNAQWESVLVVGGQQFAQVVNQLRFHKKYHDKVCVLDLVQHCCHNGPNFLFRSEFGLFAGKGSENGPNFVQKSEFLIQYKDEPINHLSNWIFTFSFSPKKKHINLTHFIT